MTSEKEEVIEAAEKIYLHTVTAPIGYGYCEVLHQLCVFDHAHAVRCLNHPARCGNLTRPHFVRARDKETYRVKKAVENNQAPDSDPDPYSHQ